MHYKAICFRSPIFDQSTASKWTLWWDYDKMIDLSPFLFQLSISQTKPALLTLTFSLTQQNKALLDVSHKQRQRTNGSTGSIGDAITQQHMAQTHTMTDHSVTHGQKKAEQQQWIRSDRHKESLSVFLIVDGKTEASEASFYCTATNKRGILCGQTNSDSAEGLQEKQNMIRCS